MKQNKQEIWRDIIGYEGYYQVSNQGRVRSLDRWVIYKNGRKRFYKGRFFEGGYTNGYRQVGLSREGKTEIFLIHQLVAMTFLNHTPNGHTLVVDHIDGIRTDNRIENLRIVTHRENISTCYRANEDSFTSDFVGVNYHKHANKWLARIVFNKKNINLGLFNNEKDASNIYQKALGEINDGTFNPENYKAKFASKYKGVVFNKNRQDWLAQPYINGKQIYLGYHSTEEEAYQTVLLYESAQPIVKNC